LKETLFKMTTVIADNMPFRQCVKNITDYLEKEQIDQVAYPILALSHFIFLQELRRTIA
jgi:hypothetical protein